MTLYPLLLTGSCKDFNKWMILWRKIFALCNRKIEDCSQFEQGYLKTVLGDGTSRKLLPV
jgi:hypothetical protein